MTNVSKKFPDMYDLIFLGGGATALNFALSYAKQKDHGKILILEKRQRYAHDRTWSFWLNTEKSFPLQDLVRQTWSKWSFSDTKNGIEHHSTLYEYASISSGIFYDHALDVIQDDPRIDLILDTDINHVKDQEGVLTIKTSKGTFHAQKIYDSRSPTIQEIHKTAPLFQTFLGYEIETDQPVFKPEKAGLMTEMTTAQKDFSFVYCLPHTTKKALIELTFFTSNTMLPGSLEAPLKKVIEDQLKVASYQIIHKEGAVLPMGKLEVRHPENISSSRYQAVGMRGGFLRRSSSYGFMAIHDWAKTACEKFIQSRKLHSYSPPRIQTLMDDHFIKTLISNPHKAPEIFMSMAQNLSAEDFARFMTGGASPLLLTKVIKSAPTLPFLKAVI